MYAAFPGETFRVLKEKEMTRFGQYRTRRFARERGIGCTPEAIKPRMSSRTAPRNGVQRPADHRWPRVARSCRQCLSGVLSEEEDDKGGPAQSLPRIGRRQN